MNAANEPTFEQLRTFYRIVRQAVLLSSYIAFVELTQEQALSVHIGRYDEPQSRSIVCIQPNGEISDYE